MLELHVWGPAFELPSIEPECLATICFCQHVISNRQWSLIVNHDGVSGATDSLPILFQDGILQAIGFEKIVSHILEHAAVIRNPDADLTPQQQMDRTALIAFFRSVATPLIHLLLYVSADNYNTATSSAYTAILPWYANYTVPPKRRNLARINTARMGLSGLDVDTAGKAESPTGQGKTYSTYESAQRAADTKVVDQSGGLSMGYKTGLGGLLSIPVYTARFRLETFSSELLEPISSLLRGRNYMLDGEKPSSVDWLAFGYLSLLFFPAVPQPWFRETMQSKHPRIVAYIHKLRQQSLNRAEMEPSDVPAVPGAAIGNRINTSLPWRSESKSFPSMVLNCAQEVLGNLLGYSLFTRRHVLVPDQDRKLANRVPSALPSSSFVHTLLGVSTAFLVGMTALAAYHRRSPRDGDLIFWALPSRSDIGEARHLLSVLANQLPRELHL